MLVPRREDRLEESSSEQGLRVGPPFSRHQAPEPSSCEFFFNAHSPVTVTFSPNTTIQLRSGPDFGGADDWGGSVTMSSYVMKTVCVSVVFPSGTDAP